MAGRRGVHSSDHNASRRCPWATQKYAGGPAVTSQLFAIESPPSPANVVAFSVHGVARTAGSKKFVGLIKQGPRAGRAILVDDSGAAGRHWRDDVQCAARKVY